MSTPIFLSRPGLVTALGDHPAAALLQDTLPDSLRSERDVLPGRELCLGRVRRELPVLEAVPRPLRSRNNALLAAAADAIRAEVEQARLRHGAARIAVILGTSTSGIGESEAALLAPDSARDFHYAQQEMGSPALFLRHYLGLDGPAYVISTACSSSAKALAAGARLIRAGIADAVVAGGADSLCRFTVAGFAALESIDPARCNPFSRHRRGINIGEGAALFLLGREPGPVRLSGWGESSDAHHMSAPDPSAAGATAAIRAALQRAGLQAGQLDYINLHGTATALNDAMEARALVELGAGSVPCSSSKPLTGHTLGAAGAIEAALCWHALVDNDDSVLPPHWFDGERDPELPALHLVAPGERAARPLRHVLSNSFAFGGSNAALVLSRSE